MSATYNARRLCALAFAAFTFPAVLILPRLGWLWAAGAAVAGASVTALLAWLGRGNQKSLPALAGKTTLGKGVLLTTLFWNFLALGRTALQVCQTYPTAKDSPLVGLLLLLLAAYAARKGTAVVLRLGAVLFFFLVGFYLLLLGFSLPDLRVQWLSPVTEVSWPALTVALTPIPVFYLSRGGEKNGGLPLWLLGGVVLAGLTALVCAGSLSPAMVASDPFPFYTAAKSVSLLGAMERLEALVSAAASVGGFCLLALLCAVNGEILREFFPKSEKLAAVCNFSLGGGCLWVAGALPGWLIAGGTTIFWGLIPLLIQSLGVRKNLKNL